MFEIFCGCIVLSLFCGLLALMELLLRIPFVAKAFERIAKAVMQ